MNLTGKTCAAVLLSFAACIPAHSSLLIHGVEVGEDIIAVQNNDTTNQYIAHKWRTYTQRPGGDRLVYTATFTQTGQATICIAFERYPETCQGVNYFNYRAGGNAQAGGALQISYKGIRGEVCSQGCVPAQRPADFTTRISVLNAREFIDDAGLKWTRLADAF